MSTREQVAVDGRRKLDEEKASYQSAKQVWDNHREIARRLALGQRSGEIAKALHISPQVVSNFRNSRQGRDILRALHEQRNAEVTSINKRIRALLPRAIDVLTEVLNDEEVKPETRVRVSADLLDRGGYGAVKKQLTANVPVNADVLEELKRRREAAENGVNGKIEVVEEIEEV